MTLFDPDTHAGVGSLPQPGQGPLARVRLTISYDGTGFHGFAVQRGVRTVGGVLGAALERLFGRPVRLTCAGRTDAGVHARGQVVHFDVPVAMRPEPLRIERSLNRQLAPAIVVHEASLSRPEFDARRSALTRRYRYLVSQRPHPDPLEARNVWWIGAPLDLAAMRLGTDVLLGEHDFAAFCRRPAGRDGEPPSLVRRVVRADWTQLGIGLLAFDIEANAFCHQMVRSLVGTLVRVGQGRLRAGDVGDVLASGERSRAAPPAPAHGLCLEAVRYPSEVLAPWELPDPVDESEEAAGPA